MATPLCSPEYVGSVLLYLFKKDKINKTFKTTTTKSFICSYKSTGYPCNVSKVYCDIKIHHTSDINSIYTTVMLKSGF